MTIGLIHKTSLKMKGKSVHNVLSVVGMETWVARPLMKGLRDIHQSSVMIIEDMVMMIATGVTNVVAEVVMTNSWKRYAITYLCSPQRKTTTSSAPSAAKISTIMQFQNVGIILVVGIVCLSKS